MKKYSRKQIVEAINYWKKQLDESDTFELNEARGAGICDAFNTIYKEAAKQLALEEKSEMESWKKAIADHKAKMEDIKRRRQEAMAKFKAVKDNLKTTTGIDIETTDDLGDIASAASDFAVEA